MKKTSAWLFLIGLGSQTQVHFIGSIGISELPIFLLAPFLFLADYKMLRDDGFMPFIWLAVLTCFGCVFSSYINNTAPMFLVKGLAHPYALFAATVVLHRFLRQDFDSLKWLLVGSFISSIISIFIFQQETYTVQGGAAAQGAEATAMVISNPLFWSSKIRSLLLLPVSAFYLSTPTVYSGCAALLATLAALLLSEGSGRAAALVSFGSAVLIIMGRKSRGAMKNIGRHIVLVGICVVLALGLFKMGYSWSAMNGYLGQEAREKYIRQTRMGDSALALLMAGRMELFCGLIACMDHPIVGFGPKGEDTGGYVESYLRKYGSPEDYEYYIKDIRYKRQKFGDLHLSIPAHSHITMFWIYYGIIGPCLWFYVLWLIYKFFTKYAYAVPQWYGYMCLASVGNVWAIFFNPFSSRIGIPLMVSCILFSKAVIDGKMQLPVKMELEARKYD